VPKLVIASRSRVSGGPRGAGAGFMLAAAAVMMPSSMALIGQACPVTVASLTTSGNTDQLVYHLGLAGTTARPSRSLSK
jgi:hypothetical protein